MPNRLTLARMTELIRARKLSATELVDAHLRQIDAVNPLINAFVMQFPSEARALARQADNEQPAGPLHGVPVTVKDSFDVRDLPTLCGSRLRLHHRASRDSRAVEKLRHAGAIILGKTNCPEFLANYETDNYITGRTNNPWNPDYTAGGSSGGEAAAIASFCSGGGIGSDGGGSIRIPAHFCGIVGLKPTPGRVSAAGHFPEITHPGGLLGVAGPMARTVKDVRILFEVLAGYDAADPFSAPVLPHRSVSGPIRIALVQSVSERPVREEVKAALRHAAILLESLGHIIDPVTLPCLAAAHGLWWFFFTELTAPFTREVLEGREAEAHWTATEFLSKVPIQQEISGRTVVENLGARDRTRAALLVEMEKHPVLLAPVCGGTAFRHRERVWEVGNQTMELLDAMSQVTPFNLTGLPAVSVPMAMSIEGMPIGVQLVGLPYQEELLLEIGEALEEARGPLPEPPLCNYS
jgi:Asp-tRNA(Asn)/Glu-tRNA(Gln) amidotransferase A subunit family amidase